MGPGWCLIWQVTAITSYLGMSLSPGLCAAEYLAVLAWALPALPCLFLCSPGLEPAGTTARAAVLWGSRWIQLNKNQTTRPLPPKRPKPKNARRRPAPGVPQEELPSKLVGQEVVAGEAVDVHCSEKKNKELEAQGWNCSIPRRQHRESRRKVGASTCSVSVAVPQGRVA